MIAVGAVLLVALGLLPGGGGPGPAPVNPRVTALSPCGGQRGTEVVVVVRGERLADPEGFLFEGPGLTVVLVAGKQPDRCEVTLRIDGDCRLGAHPLRLRTAEGLSNLVLFQVGALPVVSEQRTGDASQTVALGCTIEGELRPDERDRYLVQLDAGAVVCCEVEAMRLGFAAMDTALQVCGPDGKGLAVSDDSALGRRDPLLLFTAAAAGLHEIVVRAAVPGDSARATYRLHIGTFARPVGAVPCGGQPGDELDVRLLGVDGEPSVHVRLPDGGGGDFFAWFPELPAGPPPTPIWLRVGGPPNREVVVDEKGRARFEVPGSVHGVVASPGAAVRYRFAGKKGEEIEFRAVARSLRSPLDAVLTVRNGDGRALAANDDATTPDSALAFTPPTDGDYEIEVADLLCAGSPAHFFRLEAGPRWRPLRTSMVVAREQEAVLVVPRGGCAAAVLQIGNGTGAALLACDLPEGVTATFGPRIDGQNLVPMLLTATADAPLQGTRLGLSFAGDGAEAARDAAFAQVVTLLTGRNNTPLFSVRERALPVAVATKAPFSVIATVPTVPIVRGAPLGLQVQIQRDAGFTGRVRVRAAWAPPGITAGLLTIEEKQDKGVLPLEADAGARLGELPLVLIASGSLGRGARFEQALPFVPLLVEEPRLLATLGKARTEPGKSVELLVTLQAKQPLAAPYRALLTGLPRGVSAPALDVAADAASITFALTVAADAAVGRHRSVQVELRLGSEGGEIVHRFGGGELRIDAPLPAGTTGPGTVAGGTK